MSHPNSYVNLLPCSWTVYTTFFYHRFIKFQALEGMLAIQTALQHYYVPTGHQNSTTALPTYSSVNLPTLGKRKHMQIFYRRLLANGRPQLYQPPFELPDCLFVSWGCRHTSPFVATELPSQLGEGHHQTPPLVATELPPQLKEIRCTSVPTPWLHPQSPACICPPNAAAVGHASIHFPGETLIGLIPRLATTSTSIFNQPFNADSVMLLMPVLANWCWASFFGL